MSEPTLQISTFCLGDWMTNAYVCAVGDRCWIVDPGFGPEPVLEYVEQQGLTVERIVLTHGHVDHIAGVHAVKQAHPDAVITIHHDGAPALVDTALNLSVVLAEPVVAPEADETLTGGQTLELAGLVFEVLHTPGHSPGCITLYQADHAVALVGDTLFAGSIGRHDFPNSDGPLLMKSIREQLMPLPDATRILPGHGSDSTIGHERAHNPFRLEFLEVAPPDRAVG